MLISVIRKVSEKVIEVHAVYITGRESNDMIYSNPRIVFCERKMKKKPVPINLKELV